MENPSASSNQANPPNGSKSQPKENGERSDRGEARATGRGSGRGRGRSGRVTSGRRGQHESDVAATTQQQPLSDATTTPTLAATHARATTAASPATSSVPTTPIPAGPTRGPMIHRPIRAQGTAATPTKPTAPTPMPPSNVNTVPNNGMDVAAGAGAGAMAGTGRSKPPRSSTQNASAATTAAAPSSPTASSIPAPSSTSTTSTIVASPSTSSPPSSRGLLVLKVGSASLASDDCTFIHLSTLCALVETICQLKQEGYQIILVTSGAVAVGCQRMNLRSRPSSLVSKQALAAIGQSRLMRLYEDLFSAQNMAVAQVLLSRENMSKKHHYSNARNTFGELLRMGVIPIVNENDAVSVEELRVGDNDTLSAMVASLMQAQWLFLLTDVAGLYDSDPRSNPNAQLLHTVSNIDSLQVSLGSSGRIGTGGMSTKILAANIATAAGVHTGIIRSTELQNIKRMIGGELVGTHFLPSSSPIKKEHKRWIAHGARSAGVAVVVDSGAASAILQKRSLFSAGVVGVVGTFAAGASVHIILDPHAKLAKQGVNDAAATTMNEQAAASAPTASSTVSPDQNTAQQNANVKGRGKGKGKRKETNDKRATSAPPSSIAAPSTSSSSSSSGIYPSTALSSLPEIGVCIVNYSSDELVRLRGAHSTELGGILGYEPVSAEIAHRENIAITAKQNVMDLVSPGANAQKQVPTNKPSSEKKQQTQREKIDTSTTAAPSASTAATPSTTSTAPPKSESVSGAQTTTTTIPSPTSNAKDSGRRARGGRDARKTVKDAQSTPPSSSGAPPSQTYNGSSNSNNNAAASSTPSSTPTNTQDRKGKQQQKQNQQRKLKQSPRQQQQQKERQSALKPSDDQSSEKSKQTNESKNTEKDSSNSTVDAATSSIPSSTTLPAHAPATSSIPVEDANTKPSSPASSETAGNPASVTPNATTTTASGSNAGALSLEVKSELKQAILHLSPVKLNGVVEIVQRSRQTAEGKSPDEIEMDLDKMETSTLRELQAYVKKSLQKK